MKNALIQLPVEPRVEKTKLLKINGLAPFLLAATVE
jgi:hypothetical protein